LGDFRQNLPIRVDCDFRPTRILGIFATWSLQAYGYTLAALYAAFLLGLYRRGLWLSDAQGVPIYTDFTQWWVAGRQALNGQTGSLYDPTEFIKIQAVLAGSGVIYATWPYPPTFLLILAPLAALPYIAAFVVWGLLTLAGCVATVLFIVRRRPAIALVLACPFAVWNFAGGQNGCLTASLFGAALVFLERRPVLAGVFFGCLTYKPQFGILVPLALLASGQWRAVVSSAVTALLLASASISVFGTGVWAALPQQLFVHTGITLLADADIHWGLLQTVYGLVRYLNASAALAWLAQAATTVGVGVIVWLVWRSEGRYTLKAATLSAAALIASPWASAADMAAMVIPIAFLVTDQIRCGVLRGEQAVMLGLVAASFALILAGGRMPIGPLVTIALMSLILRRDWSWWEPRVGYSYRPADPPLGRSAP
jgi:hypothetical protein